MTITVPYDGAASANRSWLAIGNDDIEYLTKCEAYERAAALSAVAPRVVAIHAQLAKLNAGRLATARATDSTPEAIDAGG